VKAAENLKLTRVGPGTPAGDMLRRYWWPIAVAEHLGAEPQVVKLLGEEFVLFRTKKGEVGLLDKHCCHRNASLEYGRVEEDGLRCCYHGWLYDTEGRCLDQPCEPAFSDFKKMVRQGAYAVREISGFIFAYIGPKPVPEFPKYDLLFDAQCNKVVQGRDIHGNWLQRVDNMLDSLHVMALHASVYPELAMVRPDVCQWILRDYGIEMYLEYPNNVKDRHHYVFPAINRVHIWRIGREPYQFMQFVTPVDDTKCISFQIWGSEQEKGPYTIKAGKYRAAEIGDIRRIDDGWWNIWDRDQDDAAIESQGLITDRTKENLSTSDRGVVMMRKMVAQAIKDVEKGKDPIHVLRGDHSIIRLEAFKTNLGDESGGVRDPELGKKLQVVAPFEL
jgi:5,5'-dehydrodivanillate O-demethylase